MASLGLQNASAFAILMLLSLFLIVIHLGFASATALASTTIPIVTSVLTVVQTPGINVIGMTMLLQFVVSIGFILLVNSPQAMIAYGTDTFEARDFVRTGFVLTLAAMLLVVFALTYWPMDGLHDAAWRLSHGLQVKRAASACLSSAGSSYFRQYSLFVGVATPAMCRLSTQAFKLGWAD